jgi:hypothetical protein
LINPFINNSMRYWLVYILSLLVLPTMGQNRIATLADREKYGPYITPGDLIIDSPTKTEKDKRDVIYYFMPRQWPTLREGATIWIDGDKLGPVNEIKFCNTSKSLTPWHIESVRVRNIPNTRVVAGGFVCQGVLNFELDGESESFPGLAAWPDSRKFLTGSFGFHVVGNRMGGHGYTINVRNGGTIRMNGFEAQHGFSGVRINGGKEDIQVRSLEISNFYIHDTGNGEGQYLGATHRGPTAKLMDVKIHHGVVARTAAEALQLQHLAGGADIHHITIFAADVRWLNEFMAGQDTGIQWVIDEGDNRLHHLIVDGYGSIGLMPFGGNPGKSGVSRISNVLFNDGRDTGMYLHRSTSSGTKWLFDSLFFRGITETYYKETGRNERNFYISRKYGTDQFIFDNIIHDGSKRKVFEDTTGITVGRVVIRQLPAPQYVNSGFYEPAHKVKQWHRVYAPYFPVSKRDTTKIEVPTQWRRGDIAIETIGEYAFFKCIETHTADERRPGANPFFVRLTWDANGVRSDQAGWNQSLPQSAFPPDDLRLAKSCYWKKLGLGFQEDRLLAMQQ